MPALPKLKVDPLADQMEEYAADPAGFVRDAYGWGDGALAKHSGPRAWQEELLGVIGAHLQDETTRCTPLRIAVASGHGIGKSAFISMVLDWAMSTCPETRAVVTANTDAQLRTKTWPEVAKWAKLGINADWWAIPATAMYEVDHEKTWRADASPWSENNTEAFAGLHNEGKRIVLIFDEASNIADKVWEVAEGALTDEDTEIIWLAFGNPTRNTGRFRECFGKYRSLWKTRQIDSRTVEGTNKAYLDELVQTYGEESDIVKVRVRGQFPSQSVSQFIASDRVEAAQNRVLGVVDEGAPLIFGVDVARFGDDKNVIRGRKGRNGKPFKAIKWSGMDTVKSAEKIADAIQRMDPDQVFIDGGGIGGAVVDILKSWGYKVTEINFGSAAKDERRYANKRAEMWDDAKDWLGTGCIDEDVEFRDDLIGPEYMLDKNGRIILEKKEDMKARGLASPDDADAFVLTFAQPVQRKDMKTSRGVRPNAAVVNYRVLG
jgi:hypothetical protein